jgi:exopolyphosphatase / guanosine-5'-triphosphate,3'-diphosphate pyrophosphatase
MTMRLAAIDVGTNTLRLLIGEADGSGRYRPVLGDQEITRLGEGLLPARRLQPEPIRRSLTVLSRFRRLAEAHGVAAIAAVGTSALREATNPEAFLDPARRLGVDVRVVSGQEEARLTLLGVRYSLPDLPAEILMLDIGGGSTEFLLVRDAVVLAAVSTDLGSVALSERHLRSDPPLGRELAALRAAATARVERLQSVELIAVPRQASLVGTAGTITTLAAVDLELPLYDPARVNGHRLSRDRISEILERLAALPLEKRRRVSGLEPGRADVIVAGTAICLAAMEILRFGDLLVSDGGLREGILLDSFHSGGRVRQKS